MVVLGVWLLAGGGQGGLRGRLLREDHERAAGWCCAVVVRAWWWSARVRVVMVRTCRGRTHLGKLPSIVAMWVERCCGKGTEEMKMGMKE